MACFCIHISNGNTGFGGGHFQCGAVCGVCAAAHAERRAWIWHGSFPVCQVFPLVHAAAGRLHAFLLCRQFFFGMVFAVLFSFALLCIWMRMGVHFSRVKGLKILLGGAVFLIQMLMQVLPLCMLLIAGGAPPSPAGFGTQYPKEQYRGHERFFSAYEGMYARLWLLGRFLHF